MLTLRRRARAPRPTAASACVSRTARALLSRAATPGALLSRPPTLAATLSRPPQLAALRYVQSKPSPPEEKPGRWAKLKALVQEHGVVFVGYYAATWSAGAAVCYGGITVAGVDGLELLRWLHVDDVVPAGADGE